MIKSNQLLKDIQVVVLLDLEKIKLGLWLNFVHKYESLRKGNIYLNLMDDKSKLYFIINSENQSSLICNYIAICK